MDIEERLREIALELENSRVHLRESETERWGEYKERELFSTIAEGKEISYSETDLENGTRAFERTGDFAADPFKKMEYTVVVSIAIARMAAVSGGMNYIESCNLSDIYLKRLEGCRTIQEMLELQMLVVRDYANRVAKLHAVQKASPMVELCKMELARGITQPFHREELAEKAGVSPDYLTACFHKETGQTLTEYRMDRRLEAAANMLRYSDVPVGDIAERFCFSGASSFGQHFKKKYGMTPRSFRRENLNTEYYGER